MKVKFPILLKNRKQFDTCMKFLEEKGVHWRFGLSPTSKSVVKNISFPVFVMLWDGINRKHPYSSNTNFITYVNYDISLKYQDFMNNYGSFEKEF